MQSLALARLEARVGLVDHVNATLAAHDAAVLVTLLERLQGINDLHARSRDLEGVQRARNLRAGSVDVNVASRNSWNSGTTGSMSHKITPFRPRFRPS